MNSDLDEIHTSPCTFFNLSHIQATIANSKTMVYLFSDERNDCFFQHLDILKYKYSAYIQQR